MFSDPSRPNSYNVKIGHAEVVVYASSVEEAIAIARRQLAEELPRLYDIICGMDATRFEVCPAAG